MTSGNEKIRVTPVTTNELMLELIKMAIGRDENFLLAEIESPLGEDILEQIDQLMPDCILLDYLTDVDHPLDLIDRISIEFPQAMLIVILSEEHVGISHQVILAGASAFIVQPFNQQQLLSTLARVRELNLRTKVTSQPGVPTISMSDRQGTYIVFSPKGGVGSSSVAVNLSIALFEELKQELLLIDGKLLFGDLDIMLNLKTQNSIADLVPHIGALDESLVRDVVADHVSGIRVLPGPANPSAAMGIHPEELHSIMECFQGIFPNIMIDGGNFLNDNIVTFMDASHKILLIVNQEIACLRGASRFIDICRTTLSYPKDKVLVIINQYDSHESISLQDIERSLQVKVFSTLPWDRKSSLHSINSGLPVMLQSQSSALRKAYLEMARKLAKLSANRTEFLAPKKHLPEVLSKSSRLG